jgi:hypothetical protein
MYGWAKSENAPPAANAVTPLLSGAVVWTVLGRPMRGHENPWAAPDPDRHVRITWFTSSSVSKFDCAASRIMSVATSLSLVHPLISMPQVSECGGLRVLRLCLCLRAHQVSLDHYGIRHVASASPQLPFYLVERVRLVAEALKSGRPERHPPVRCGTALIERGETTGVEELRETVPDSTLPPTRWPCSTNASDYTFEGVLMLSPRASQRGVDPRMV